VLPAKAQARQLSFAQSLPEDDLRQTYPTAQLAGAPEYFARRPHAPSTMLRMVPLPRCAGEEPPHCRNDRMIAVWSAPNPLYGTYHELIYWPHPSREPH
jgi:hypothetical protein